MMQDQIKTYRLLLDRFEEIIYNNIVIKLATFRGFNKSLTQDNETTLKSFPLLPIIIESLQVDNVLTVSKIVEKRGERTIHHFLQFAKINFAQIQQQFPKLTMDIITANEEELKGINDQIRRIKTQRDKYYAHSDKEYFLKPGNVLKDFPQTYDDIVDISIALQNIISQHRQIVYGDIRICISDFVYLNTFKTIDLLKNASKEWYSKYRLNETF